MCVCVCVCVCVCSNTDQNNKVTTQRKKKKKMAAYPGLPMIRTDPKTCSRAAAQRNSQTH